MEKGWYVLHTYSGYENKVKANLESRTQSMGMENNIFRVIVPEEETHETKNGKDKVVMKKTFPGYVLLEMILTDEAWFVVRNTPGVTGFVGSHGGGSKPEPLLDDEVKHVLHDLGLPSRNHDIDFEIGESVRIVEGPFEDMVGDVSHIDDEKMKLKVNITMFDRQTIAEVDFDQVDKV